MSITSILSEGFEGCGEEFLADSFFPPFSFGCRNGKLKITADAGVLESHQCSKTCDLQRTYSTGPSREAKMCYLLNAVCCLIHLMTSRSDDQ